MDNELYFNPFGGVTGSFPVFRRAEGPVRDFAIRAKAAMKERVTRTIDESSKAFLAAEEGYRAGEIGLQPLMRTFGGLVGSLHAGEMQMAGDGVAFQMLDRLADMRRDLVARAFAVIGDMDDDLSADPDPEALDEFLTAARERLDVVRDVYHNPPGHAPG